MNIFQKTTNLLNQNIASLLPPVMSRDIVQDATRFMSSLEERICETISWTGSLLTKDNTIREKLESEAPAPSTVINESQAIEKQPAIHKFRQRKTLTGDALKEILDSLSDKNFQVDHNRQFHVSEGDTVNTVKTTQALEKLTIVFRAEFLDTARSLFNLSLSVFEGPGKRGRFELENFPMVINQLSGDYPRTIYGDSSVSGQIKFKGIETGSVCKIITADGAYVLKEESSPIHTLSARANTEHSQGSLKRKA